MAERNLSPALQEELPFADYYVDFMRPEDIPSVCQVDRESYSVPWPVSAYRRELSENAHARYIVLCDLNARAESSAEPSAQRFRRPRLPWEKQATPREGQVIGYAGMWLIATDEAHITTIAVTESKRRLGLGELLLQALIEMSYAAGVRWMTLEVRVSNDVAKRLYTKYGFHEAGLRKRYYSDNNEDALIMSTDDITLNVHRARFEQQREDLRRRLSQSMRILSLIGEVDA
jgi:ribosomal-protein-alanine N-acetyltransferase